MAWSGLEIMPSSIPIATAVSLWSPVIIIGRMPASPHSTMAALTSRTDRNRSCRKVRCRSEILLQEFRLRIGGNRIPVPLCASRARAGPCLPWPCWKPGWRPSPLCHGDSLSALNRVGTALEHLVGRSLCILYDVSVRSLVNSRHHLTHGIERSLSDTGIRFLQLCLLIAVLRRVVDQGALGGLAQQPGRPARPIPRRSRGPCRFSSSFSSSATCSTTVILFWVRVPVLSEQIICVHPSVSTAVSLRMMALRFDMFVTPMESTMVTTAASPSGIAATARETLP